DRGYRLVRANEGGRRLLGLAGPDGVDLAQDPRPNLLTILFDPDLRPLFVNWDDVAGQVLRRLQRAVLRDPGDEELASLLAELLATPGIPDNWRSPNLRDPSDPMVSMVVEMGEVRLRLLVTITVFHAPDNVTLEELQIENYLPLDEATRRFFHDAAG
ncbi:MAG: hypothetical protein AAFN30_20485, partial [Actinomycetota bacterium]